MKNNVFQPVSMIALILFLTSSFIANDTFAQVIDEHVQVDGIIHTTDGGIKFPDNTVQTTAATTAAMQGGPSNAAPTNGQPMLWVDDSGSGLISITDTIGILGFENLGIVRAATLSGGGGSSPAEILRFKFTKNIDHLSPYFLLNTANGRFIFEIHMRLPNSNGDTYQHYIFKESYFESVIGKSVFDGTGYKNIEEVTFLTSVIEVETWVMGASGPFMCWNQITNDESCSTPAAR